MSNFSQQQPRQKENNEKNKLRKEKLAAYLYDLSKLVFATSVLGAFAPYVSHSDVNYWGISMGCIATYALAFIANRILK